LEQVILVDEKDQEIGLMEKMEAHQKGMLHRAFSVFVFNSKQEILLQQRALSKYHSGGLWTNTCCSHPRSGESIVEAANRRMLEEMGFSCNLAPVFSFIYKAELDNELSEHELDHVLIGFSDEIGTPNPDEVMDTKWVTLTDLELEVKENPENFTAWFRIIMNESLPALKRALEQ
jgi:isopentenyl-diphosphate delta-isomerase